MISTLKCKLYCKINKNLMNGGHNMNKTKTPTASKITYPLRLQPKTYKEIRAKVNSIREKDGYAYSINDFLTEIIEKGLKEKL